MCQLFPIMVILQRYFFEDTFLNTYVTYKISGLGFDERVITINIDAIGGATGYAKFTIYQLIPQ